MAGCAVEAPAETSATQLSVSTAKLPPEAAKLMKEAADQHITALFYECPPAISFDPVALDANGGEIATDWTAIRGAFYMLDKPRFTGAASRNLVCGTTQSTEGFLNVRKWLPTGYTSCTTSAVGVVPAWFVCT